MIEKLNEAKALIDAGELEAAKAKIDEVIAGIPATASKDPDEPYEPLPGEGTNGYD